jgi:hypothetical protein
LLKIKLDFLLGNTASLNFKTVLGSLHTRTDLCSVLYLDLHCEEVKTKYDFKYSDHLVFQIPSKNFAIMMVGAVRCTVLYNPKVFDIVQCIKPF